MVALKRKGKIRKRKERWKPIGKNQGEKNIRLATCNCTITTIHQLQRLLGILAYTAEVTYQSKVNSEYSHETYACFYSTK